MWVTQTYLKSPEPDAKLHIYYLFEAYNDAHLAATKRAQRELEEFSRGNRPSHAGVASLKRPSAYFKTAGFYTKTTQTCKSCSLEKAPPWL